MILVDYPRADAWLPPYQGPCDAPLAAATMPSAARTYLGRINFYSMK
jgi:hypothetical protein